MSFILAVVASLVAWGLHALLAQTYLRKLDWNSWQFSLIHGLEILIAPAIVFYIYFKYLPALSPGWTALTALATILAIDAILFNTILPEGRQLLTLRNFVIPVAAVVLMIYFIGKSVSNS